MFRLRNGSRGERTPGAENRRRTMSSLTRLEWLEARCLLTTVFTVNDSGNAPLDSTVGPGETAAGTITLRSAIQQFNLDGVGGTIDFSVSKVNVQSALDPITASGVTINGGTVGSVVVSGGSSYDGFDIAGGNALVENLVINGFEDGIAVGSSGNTVEHNYIGTDSTGTVAAPNSIGIFDFTGGNTFFANVVSGNTSNGIEIFSGVGGGDDLVEGNKVGTDPAGTAAVPNQGFAGIDILSATGNTIGGTTAGTRNIISGNAGYGLGIFSTGNVNNLVEGNYVGTDPTGKIAVPNQGGGISLESNGNTIGLDNVISGNTGDGVDIEGGSSNFVNGNAIGTNAAGTAALGNKAEGVFVANGSNGTPAANSNTIGGNVISGNGTQGVNIGGGSDNVVEGNFIGTNLAGESAVPNQGNGIDDDGTGTTIGGTTAGAGNLISGNGGNGISIGGGAIDDLVAGNFVGIDDAGKTALPNQEAGIAGGSDGNGTTIGGTTAGARNLISGNKKDGVALGGGILFEGNFVGTDSMGAATVPNQSDAGVYVFSGDNTIGGTTAGATNVISGNAGDGIAIVDHGDNLVEGNLISLNGDAGIALTSTITGGALANTIGGTTAAAANVISGNTGDGIDINIGSMSNVVEGNKIGTDSTGMLAVPNGGAGVNLFSGATINTIGGAVAGAGNVISGNTGDGIDVSGQNNRIEGNFIGTDAAGTAAVPNQGSGIYFAISASENTIGGTFAVMRNIISGNAVDGLDLYGVFGTIIVNGPEDNLIEGNYIGTDVSGTVALPNQVSGIQIVGAANHNTIGGKAAGAGNVISGNVVDGIDLIGGSLGVAGDNTVNGNFIGTDPSGTLAVPNQAGGVSIVDGTGGTTGNNTISGNVISGNGGDGVLIFGGSVSGAGDNLIGENFIGTDMSATVSVPNKADGVQVTADANDNTIGGNVISNNRFDGVLISSDDNLVDGNQVSANGAAGIMILGESKATGNTIGGAGNAIAAGRGLGNVITDNGEAGIVIENGNDNLVEGNSVLSNQTGNLIVLGTGVVVDGTGNTIGGTIAGAGNLISGNNAIDGPDGNGLAIPGSGNLVEGNFIGTDSSGTAAMPNHGDGIDVGGSNNTIGGTIAAAANVISGNAPSSVPSNDTGSGIGLGGDDNLVEGNLIGTDESGMAAVPNHGLAGIVVENPSTDDTIGGTTAGAANVISGNTGDGILIASNFGGNLIEGNFIGTDAPGTLAVPNQGAGVRFADIAVVNTVGGTTAGAANVISGNLGDGVDITGANESLVEGNFIGTNAAGDNLGNILDGVAVTEDSDNGESSSDNTIGGTTAGAGNTIAFNQGNGVTVGSSAGDTATIDNSILGNSIHDNAKLGIDLGDDGVTPNSNSDATRSGPNNFINTPVFTLAQSDPSGTTISGTYLGAPNTLFRVEFFSNPAADPSGHGQGQTYLGYANVDTDANGNGSFVYHISTTIAVGQAISATATNPSGNTSEFAADLPVTASPTPEIAIVRGGFRFNFATRQVVQLVTLTNTGSTAINGPISLVLDNLASGVTLINASGTTDSSAPPAGSPYINVPLTNNTLLPNQSVTVLLTFSDPKLTAIFYSTRVLTGTAAR